MNTTTVNSTGNDIRAGFEKIGRQAATAGRNLWLASLGAVAVLGDEGQELLERLVERGRPLSERQLARFEQARRKAAKLAADTRDLARETVEYEAHRAARLLGVMTGEDLKAFSARLETLAKKIDDLTVAGAVESEDEEAEGVSASSMAAAPGKGRGRRKAAAADSLN